MHRRETQLTISSQDLRRRTIRQPLSAIQHPDTRDAPRCQSQHHLRRQSYISFEGTVRPLPTGQPCQRPRAIPVVDGLILYLLEGLHGNDGGAQVAGEAAVATLTLREIQRGLAHEMLEVAVTVVLDDAAQRHYRHRHRVCGTEDLG